MKAPKGFSVKTISLIAGWMLTVCHPATSQSFSEGKNLGQLREAIRPGGTQPASFHKVITGTWLSVRGNRLAMDKDQRPVPAPVSGDFHPAFLPRWTPESLPFFCRIEHDFAQKNTLPLKFRLGSVEYVDWLEGKTDSPALPPR